MHITDSSLTLASHHRLESEVSRQIVLDAEPGASFQALLIDGLRPLAEADGDAATGLQQEKPAVALDKALQALIHALFGSNVGTPEETAAPEVQAIQNGVRSVSAVPQLEIVHTREEESCSFSASGNICLADGSERQFEVGYEMARSEESTRLSYGAGLRDPLVLDYIAPSNALGAHSVAFDLDADGRSESMRMPDPGAALLFHDGNGNGIADNGSELFGPQSGNGFADLAKLDSDGNRWIDGNDAAYADLKLWSMGSDGTEHVESLAEASIGALSTGYADTPFSIKEDGQVVGQVRGTGVWLGEEGGAGSVRQIDIATSTTDTEAAAANA